VRKFLLHDTLPKLTSPTISLLGITQAALAPITITLAQVQAHILRLLSPPLPNALSRPPLHQRHHPLQPPSFSDMPSSSATPSALIYHHPLGRPLKPGLTWLTKKWCGQEIQTRVRKMCACLELLNKKLDGGPGFGEFKTDMELIFERVVRSSRRRGVLGRWRSIMGILW
jgi:RNA exonuclease 1